MRRWSGAFFVGVVLFACGDFGTNAPAPAGDASAPTDGGLVVADGVAPLDDGASKEAGTIKRCDPSKPFEVGTQLGLVGPFLLYLGVRLSHDELTAYVWTRERLGTSTLADNTDFFILHRPSVAASFHDAVAIDALNTPASESFPTLTDDEKTMYFSRGDAGQRELLVATRGSGDLFNNGVGLALPPWTGGHVPDESNPWVRVDGSLLYFTSHGRPSGIDDYEIFNITPHVAGPSYVPMPTLSSPTPPRTDSTPVFDRDEHTVLFKSNRTDGLGDIYEAHRPDRNTDFGPPKLVGVSTNGVAEAPNWLSDDGCILYYTINQGDATRTLVAKRGL